MTVTAETIRWSFAGNGTAVSFPIPERVRQQADLAVYLIEDATGTVDPQVYDVDYEIDGLNDDEGCSVEFVTAPAAGFTVLVLHLPSLTQPTAFPNLGRYTPQIHQDALDRVVTLVKGLAARVERAWRVPLTSASLPETDLQASKFPYINASKQLTFVDGSPSDPLTVVEWEATATADQQEFHLEHSYTPGSGQLAVHISVTVGGVPGLLKQVAGVHYTETDSDTIDFLSPLAAGTLVQFTLGAVRDISMLRPAMRMRPYTLTEGQTTVTSALSYTPGNNEIFAVLNGAVLEIGVDLLETSSTSFTFGTGVTIAANDRLMVFYGQGFDPASLDITQADLGATLYPRTPPEIAAGVAPVNYWYPPGHDIRYGALADGTTNDRAALQASIDQWEAGGSSPKWRPRTYYIGSLTSGAAALEVSGKRRGFLDSAGAKLSWSTGDSSATAALRFTECADLMIGPLEGTDTGYVAASSTAGGALLEVVATSAADTDLGRITFTNPRADSCRALLRIRGDAAGAASTNQTNRIRGIKLINASADSCYYGIEAQNHGDSVSGDLTTNDCYTSVYAYGVSGWRLDVNGIDPAWPSDQIILEVRDRSMADMRLEYRTNDASVNGPVVLKFYNDTQDESIRDIDLTLHLRDAATTAYAVRLAAYAASTGLVRTSTTNIWDNIRLRGDWSNGTTTGGVLVYSAPSTEGRIILDGSLGLGADVVDWNTNGMVVVTEQGREIRSKRGDLTSGSAFVIPLARYDGAKFALLCTLYADANSADTSSAQAIERVLLVGYNASGGAVTISTNTTQFSGTNYVTTDPVVTYAASGENINVTVAGAGFNNAAAYGRLTVEHLARFA